MTNYERERRDILNNIFELNLDICDEVAPYDYGPDIRGILLEEQYTLTIGGHDARSCIHNSINGLIETMLEFVDDDRVTGLCEELIDTYKDYENNYLFLTT